MVILSRRIAEGHLTVFANGDYVVVSGDPADADAQTTYYGTGHGPQHLQFLAAEAVRDHNRRLELQQARSTDRGLDPELRRPETPVSQRPTSGRIPPPQAAEAAAVELHRRAMRGTAVELGDDLIRDRYHEPSTAPDIAPRGAHAGDQALRRATARGTLSKAHADALRLAVELGSLHGELKELIRTQGDRPRYSVADPDSTDVSYGFGYQRIPRVPTELQVAIEQGLVRESSSGMLSVSWSISDPEFQGMEAEFPGFLDVYTRAQDEVRVRAIWDHIVELVTTIAEIALDIIAVGAGLGTRLVRWVARWGRIARVLRARRAGRLARATRRATDAGQPRSAAAAPVETEAAAVAEPAGAAVAAPAQSQTLSAASTAAPPAASVPAEAAVAEPAAISAGGVRPRRPALRPRARRRTASGARRDARRRAREEDIQRRSRELEPSQSELEASLDEWAGRHSEPPTQEAAPRPDPPPAGTQEAAPGLGGRQPPPSIAREARLADQIYEAMPPDVRQRARELIGQSLHPLLRELWREAVAQSPVVGSRMARAAELIAAAGRARSPGRARLLRRRAKRLADRAYDATRSRFWEIVNRTPEAIELLTRAGIRVHRGTARTPDLVHGQTGEVLQLSLEHPVRRVADPLHAIDDTLQLVPRMENSVVLESVRRHGRAVGREIHGEVFREHR